MLPFALCVMLNLRPLLTFSSLAQLLGTFGCTIVAFGGLVGFTRVMPLASLFLGKTINHLMVLLKYDTCSSSLPYGQYGFVETKPFSKVNNLM
ncbi:Uncharacterized protein TCM_015449 [Theobroma cacao]|uniref:Uncharacterized protein n=1 Tax=Theobroma cacao TaxID=3641 RepID=A0A061G992_THECC|nr:Uncharacterized protein TCM_015449 [Theobroma cacao]